MTPNKQQQTTTSFNGSVTLPVKPRPNHKPALTSLESTNTIYTDGFVQVKAPPLPTMLHCARHHPAGVTWDPRLPDFLSTIKPANNVAGACQDCRRSCSLCPASLLQSAVLLMVHWGEGRVLQKNSHPFSMARRQGLMSLQRPGENTHNSAYTTLDRRAVMGWKDWAVM